MMTVDAEAIPAQRSLRARLVRAADECWRAGQLVIGFLAAGTVFSVPPQEASRIFTPEVMAMRAAQPQSTDGARTTTEASMIGSARLDPSVPSHGLLSLPAGSGAGTGVQQEP